MLALKTDKRKNIMTAVVAVVFIAGIIYVFRIFVFTGEEAGVDLKAQNSPTQSIIITPDKLKIRKVDTSIFQHPVFKELQKKNYEIIEPEPFDVGNKNPFTD